MSQESNSSSALPEGQELLDGLYAVQSYLTAIDQRVARFVALEREFRSRDSVAQQKLLPHKEVIKVQENKGQYTLFVLGIALTVYLFLIGLVSGNAVEGLVMGGVSVAVFAAGRSKNNKLLLRLGTVLIVLLLVGAVGASVSYYSRALGSGDSASATGAAITTGMMVVALVAAIVVAGVMLAMRNRSVTGQNAKADAENEKIDEHNRQVLAQLDEHNRQVAAQRTQLSSEIQGIKQQMLDATGSWFPPDYYCSAVVEQFIASVRNHQADTIKEMVTVYKEDAYRANVLSNQQQMKAQFDQALYNQQQMIQLQKVSNALQMCNLIANIATAENTADIAASNREVASNTRATAANTAATARNTAAAAASADSVARDTDSIARKMRAKW